MDRQHSEQYLKMALRKDRVRKVSHPDGYGKNTGQCGDTVEFFLVVDQDRIEHAFFQTNGCLNTLVCGNAVAEFTAGKRVEDAWKIIPEEIIDYLKTLPTDHYHCAELAVGALYRALADLQENRKKPWMKLYKV